MTDGQMRMWLRECYRAAIISPDPSTQLGAMIVDQAYTPRLNTRAFNGPVKGWLLQPEDLERPRKYQIIEHAERRAIYRAAKFGWPLEDCTIVCTWAACCDCARAIIEAGIIKLVRHVPPSDDAVDRWLEDVSLGDEIMKNAGVIVTDIYGPIPGAPPILRGGELFYPDGGSNGS